MTIRELLEEVTGTETGTDVDVVAATIKVEGDPAELRKRLDDALSKDKSTRTVINRHRGSVDRLAEHVGGRDMALRLMALGVHAGAWKMQSAVELLRQTREKAVEMAQNGFLYVKTL